MVGSRVHKVGETELANIAEALQGGGVKDGQDVPRDLDVPMDRVLDIFIRLPKLS
jgi:hypothetical protein